jgi:hypothetical protein
MKKKKLRTFAKKHKWSIVIPEVKLEQQDIHIKWYLVRLYHGLPVSGHLGITGTCTLIRQRFYWKNMKTDVQKWIAACHPCQRRKVDKQNSTGKRRTVLQKRPFETVSIDLVGPFPETAEGYTYVLTMVCHFTRYPIAVPIVSKEAKVVARALKKHLFTEYPFWPTKILSDRGTEFVNHIIDLLYKQLGVKQKITTHDNAQANQVERFHRYMNAAIACFIQQKERQHLWEEYLDCAVYVYRCMTNNSTGHSPFYALYGVEPIKPMDMILNGEKEIPKYDKVSDYIEVIKTAMKEAYMIMHQNQINMTIKRLDGRAENKTEEYKKGDLVWMWKKHAPNKLEYRYQGPYIIHEKLDDDNYRIYVGNYKSRTKKHNIGDPHYKTVTVRHIRHYQPFEDQLIDTSPQWITREEKDEGYPLLELNIPEEEKKTEENNTEEKESSEINPGEMKGDFLICPYWEWDDILQDKIPFSVVKIIEHKDNDTYIIRRYGNNNNDVFGVQRPGWIHHKTRRIQYTQQITKNNNQWLEYTNDINKDGFKTQHTLWRDSFCSHSEVHLRFELTDKKTIPLHIMKCLERNEYIRNFEFNPFSLEDE